MPSINIPQQVHHFTINYNSLIPITLMNKSGNNIAWYPGILGWMQHPNWLAMTSRLPCLMHACCGATRACWLFKSSFLRCKSSPCTDDHSSRATVMAKSVKALLKMHSSWLQNLHWVVFHLRLDTSSRWWVAVWCERIFQEEQAFFLRHYGYVLTWNYTQTNISCSPMWTSPILMGRRHTW